VENKIKELGWMKAYKCFGVEERNNIDHKNEEKKLKNKHIRRFRLILKTEISKKKKIQAIGTLVISVLN
jgi:hypothetical protein